jgi:hypothetical protein
MDVWASLSDPSLSPNKAEADGRRTSEYRTVLVQRTDSQYRTRRSLNPNASAERRQSVRRPH